MALGLGRLGLRLGGRRGGGAAPVAPSFTTSPTITDQPLVGVSLSMGEFSYAGDAPITPTYAWELAGTPIGGATSATYTPVAGDFGKTLSCVVTLTNAAGFVGSEATATLVVGKTLAETWSGYTSGDAWATIDTLYTRGSSAFSAAIITDVSPAPSLKSAAVTNVSSSSRACWRDDMETFIDANSAEVDFMEGLHLNRHHDVAGGRYGVRGTDASISATSRPPVAFGPHVYQNNIWLQISTDIDTNAGTSLGSALTDGDLYWTRYRYTATEVWGKLWLDGVAEPTLWEKRACTPPYQTIIPAISIRNATAGGSVVYDNLYFAAGWNAVAPFPDGYVPPVAVSSDPQTFAAATSQSTITAMDSLFTFSVTDV